MSARNGGGKAWLGGLADEADRFVRSRIERLAAAARQQTDQLAEHAGERFASHLVDQISRRLAARLARAAAAVGAVVIAVGLLAVGVAGALGEVFGRAWLGHLAAGVLTLLVVLAAGAVARTQARRRSEREAAAAERAAAEQSAPKRDAADADEAASGVTGALGRAAAEAGADLLRRHPVASLAAISAAGMLAGSLLARSDGRSPGDD